MFYIFNKYFPFLAKFLSIWLILATWLIFQGCANQLPPGGGEEDKIPPKIVNQVPKPNTLNYNGNSITIAFDKYVDRRSLQDAFLISPPMGGTVEYNWSGKEVEIKFSRDFSNVGHNKTFVITLNSNLKDLHGNSLSPPITFAFSTGSKIDKGSISGYIINPEKRVISIFGYKLTTSDSDYNPTKKFADYITEADVNGEYKLSYLAPGSYRVVAVYDDDKNLLWTADREDFGVLSRDIILTDTEGVRNENFYLKNISTKNEQPEFSTSNYFKDSLDIILTSIENNSKNVLPDQSIFIFFSKFKPAREEFVNNFKLTDNNGTPIKMIYNWINDSLIETFAANKFEMNNSYNLASKLNISKDSVYNFILKFTVISQNSFGEVKGVIRNKNVEDSLPVTVHFELKSKENRPEIKYTFTVTDTIFDFKNIAEGDYKLFTFMDINRNDTLDFGNPYPFRYSEPIYLYPKDISIRGGWAVEDVFINFSR